jgi:hypothetical protein
MEVALYVRVSTTRQQQTQTIEQQIARLREHLATHPDWHLGEEHIYRDDGYSGGKLNRPGLDRLRDRAAMAGFERILITAPDRLARNYVHQMLLIDELAQWGCQVEFLERPMSQDPHDQLLLQIRGADVPAHAFANIVVFGTTRLGQQSRRGHDLARRAVSTLKRVMLHEGCLHWMQRIMRGKAFNRGDLVAVMHDGQREAGIDPAAIHMDGASAALTVVASLLASKQRELFTQGVEQRGAGVHLKLSDSAVDAQADGLHHHVARLKI